MDAVAGRIGPNAITRVAEVLPARVGEAATLELFRRVGLAHYLATPPERMVDEAEVRRLHHALRAALGGTLSAEIATAAGRRTGEYLLANRIPKPLQAVLKRIPAGLAARVLLSAISRHAWTFVGSGRFEVRLGRPVVLTIRGNPLCRELKTDLPACDFYAATFECLFRALVHPASRVREVACEACGDPACRFEIGWG